MLATSSSVYHIRSPSAPISAKTHKLVLTTTSLRNVVLANSSDVLYYEVVTPGWARSTTRVARRNPTLRVFDTVGEVRRDDEGQPIAVSVRGSEYVPVHEFLNEGEAGGSRQQRA